MIEIQVRGGETHRGQSVGSIVRRVWGRRAFTTTPHEETSMGSGLYFAEVLKYPPNAPAQSAALVLAQIIVPRRTR